MILEAMAELLEQAELGQRGSSIFIGAMPADVATGLRLIEGQGEAGEIPGIRRSDVQIVAKANAYSDAYALANGTFNALKDINRVLKTGIEIFSIRPWSQPFAFGREEGADWNLAVNFTAIWRED